MNLKLKFSQNFRWHEAVGQDPVTLKMSNVSSKLLMWVPYLNFVVGSSELYIQSMVLHPWHVKLDKKYDETTREGQELVRDAFIQNNKTQTQESVSASALLIYAGAVPRTDWLAGVVERDAQGYLISGHHLMRDGRRPAGWTLDRDPFYLETSVPGVFVAGDVRYGSIKRVASAVGEGSIAVQFVHQYLAGF